VGLWLWGLGPQNFVSRCGRKIVTSSFIVSLEAVDVKLRFREPELQGTKPSSISSNLDFVL